MIVKYGLVAVAEGSPAARRVCTISRTLVPLRSVTGSLGEMLTIVKGCPAKGVMAVTVRDVVPLLEIVTVMFRFTACVGVGLKLREVGRDAAATSVQELLAVMLRVELLLDVFGSVVLLVTL
ncbi:hypothetical protein HY009_00405, partial [Candidatus Acetothermia bacterium]|nr:hypothetical protein [Candidatus Acetothermia bacterium]